MDFRNNINKMESHREDDKTVQDWKEMDKRLKTFEKWSKLFYAIVIGIAGLITLLKILRKKETRSDLFLISFAASTMVSGLLLIPQPSIGLIY